MHASGPLGRAHCVIHGNQNYKQTGLLQAYAAYSLLQQPPKRVGFASGCQAFGHRELLGVLRASGWSRSRCSPSGAERRATGRLPGQGRVARCRRALPDHRRRRRRRYAEVQELSRRVAAALVRPGVAPGDKVAILSANDPVAFTCVFGISRAGAVWCPINPRNEAAENRELLDLFDCRC